MKKKWISRANLTIWILILNTFFLAYGITSTLCDSTSFCYTRLFRYSIISLWITIFKVHKIFKQVNKCEIWNIYLRVITRFFKIFVLKLHFFLLSPILRNSLLTSPCVFIKNARKISEINIITYYSEHKICFFPALI